MADKLGSYTRVLLLTLTGSGIFHTVLLFIPSVTEITIVPTTFTFEFESDSVLFSWSKCPDMDDFCPNWEVPGELMDLHLDGCNLECPLDDIQICEATTSMYLCQANGTEVIFKEVNITQTSKGK